MQPPNIAYQSNVGFWGWAHAAAEYSVPEQRWFLGLGPCSRPALGPCSRPALDPQAPPHGLQVQFELDMEKGPAALLCRQCSRPTVPNSK